MLRNIRGRDKELREGDRIVRQEQHSQNIRDVRIGVDDACNVDDEADRKLRLVIPGGSLPSEEDNSR